MRKIKMQVGTDIYGSKIKDEMMFEDNATEEDIQECFIDWVWSNIDAGWWEEDE